MEPWALDGVAESERMERGMEYEKGFATCELMARAKAHKAVGVGVAMMLLLLTRNNRSEENEKAGLR